MDAHFQNDRLMQVRELVKVSGWSRPRLRHIDRWSTSVVKGHMGDAMQFYLHKCCLLNIQCCPGCKT